MPRPRLVSDQEVFAAFDAAIAEHGPNGVTLARVAKRLGITAPALMRRFRSKDGLFAAFMAHELAAQPAALSAVLARHADPLQALMALSGGTHQYSQNPKAYLRHLASFFLQLADDDALVPVIARWFAGERHWIAERIEHARTMHALTPETPVHDLARTVQAALHGARLQWATGGEGPEGAWSERELLAVLAPWRTAHSHGRATLAAAAMLDAPADIRTPRLVVRDLDSGDLPALLAVNGDDAVTEFLPPYASWRSLGDAEQWQQRMERQRAEGSARQFVVADRTTGTAIGSCLLLRYEAESARAELGYVLGRAHWGAGYMTEALRALLAWSFGEGGIRRLEAQVHPRNLASVRVLERLGFTREGTLHERWVHNDVPYDVALYGLLKRDFSGDPGGGHAHR